MLEVRLLYAMKAKHLPMLFLAFLLLAGSGAGCATEQMLREAKPHYKFNPETKDYDDVPGNKRAYAGVPFAFLWDVATAPIWGPFALCAYAFDKH